MVQFSLYHIGPLAMGFGVVFASSIASNFLPPTTALGAGVMSLALYGGLIALVGFYVATSIVGNVEISKARRFTGFFSIGAGTTIFGSMRMAK